MNLNELEKELRDFRPSHPEKINTDVLWDRVLPHITQPKRKNRVLPFFLLLLSLVLGIFITKTVFLNDNNGITSDNQQVTNANVNTIKTENYTTDIDNEIIQKEESQKNNLIQKDKLDFDKKIISCVKQNNSSSKGIEKEQNENLNSKTAIKSDVKSNITQSAENKAVLNTSLFTNTISENRTIKVNAKSPAESDRYSDQELKQNINTDLEDQINIKKSSNDIAETKNTIFAKSSAELNKSILSENLETTNINVRKTINISTLLPANALLNVDKNEPSFLPRRISPYVFRDHPKVSIEFGGSYLSPARTLTLTNPEFSSELENRQLAEEILEGWYASVGFRYNVTPQIGLNVGMQYGKINERSATSLSYSETLFLQDTIIGNLVRVDGTIEPIYGDIEIDRTIMKNVNRINTYSFLQMPIEIMYTQPINRLNVEAGFGIIQNISFKQKGFWHPDSRTEYDLSLDESGYLKSRIGLALTGRIGIGYDLTPGIGVYAHGRYIKHLSGITSTNYGIDQSYSLIGAELGLRLHLFN